MVHEETHSETGQAADPASGSSEATYVEGVDRADAADVVAVLALAEEAARVDGASPLSEQTRLELRHGAPGTRELLLRRADGTVAGYAHLDLSDPHDGPSGELVVAPADRGRGDGRKLVGALWEEARHRDATGRLRVWAHGKQPAAEHLAAEFGFTAFRELWQMRRATDLAVPETPPPPGVTIRTFVPGRDDEAWLAINAKAFAHHPEQGAWTLDDLRRRIAEPWFDPAGFFLAEDASGRLVGFHWTKVHPATADEGALGEVYVVGVDPAAQGGGLGKVLTAVGLRHLAQTEADGGPLAEVLLYVDADNEAAVSVYTRLGFRVHTVDVMYRKQED
ncbi:mycothiol synthase [Yinghuangia seranimata]|uniref:mycothiol synthase n=1 Tax=Yinghuangia seranimata TaxID=408067 RepID=UPI00248B3C73|nr:mycothiol synthase [Yinghuangia seranimata]MDI2131738.1 mycothiol synthase [Yinghuangia seranimata]